MPIHEELLPRVATGLGAMNYLINQTNDGTLWSAATDAASFNAITVALESSSAYHEDQKPIFRINARTVSSENAMGIFTDTEIAAGNTTALIRAGFTDNDGTLSASYLSGRGL